MARLGTLLVLILVGGNGSLRAQEVIGRSLTVTPSVGLATVFETDGEISSGGMATYLELDLSGIRWRWSVFASQRGIGVGCSDGCDLGGRAFGVGVSYLRGRVGFGGGLAGLRRSTGWHGQPFAQLAFVRAPYSVQLRVEVPNGAEGVHVPVLFGIRIPLG